MCEEQLLSLFENANIHLGKLDPRVIRAWFDTDCENVLKWICTSITEDCYVSAQQESEYSELVALPNEELNKEMKRIEAKYPELLHVKENLWDIEVAKDSLEMLQDQLKDCEEQIYVNQQVQQSLQSELSAVSAEDIQTQLEEESEYEKCLKFSRELDNIHNQTYDHIKKYSLYLSNYEYVAFPGFANCMDFSEFEEKLSDAKNALNAMTNGEEECLEKSSANVVADTILELESRIFNTKISNQALQMEIKALNSVLKFLECYDRDLLLSFVDIDSIQRSVEVSKDQQSWMLKVVEETTLKIAQQCVNQPTLKCLRNELQYHQLKLGSINRFKECLMKILLHSVILHIIYFQEKNDIKSSTKFFKNVNLYINTDLKNSSLRKESMVGLISQFEEFCLSPLQKKFKLIGDFGLICLNNRDLDLREVIESTNMLRTNTRKLKKQHFNCPITYKIFEDLRSNIKILQDFLTSGPSSRMLTISNSLQRTLFQVNKVLKEQNTSVKLLISKVKNPIDNSRDKWMTSRSRLWTYFMTDGAKMLSLLEQIKTAHSKEENVLAI